MTVLLIIGLLLVAMAAALIVRGLLTPRLRTSRTVEQVSAYGFAASTPEAGSPPRTPVLGFVDSIAAQLGGILARWFGAARENDIRLELVSAGIYSITPRRFLGYRALSLVGVPALFLWVATSAHLSVALTVAGGAISFAAGWVLPNTIVDRRKRERFAKIDRELPELIDLLVVTVEAGLGFNASLQTAARRLEGPLGDELRLTLQEQSLGLSAGEALRNMLVRAETPAMRSFVRSILQGEQLGVSIGQIMRNLAREMRLRRRQDAEERAQKAPVKLLFPLVFLIFPAMFIVLLAPAVFSFLQSFGSGR
jgi:tight adherence protein C